MRRRENRIRVRAQEVAFSSSNHVEEAALLPFSLCRYFLIIPLASFVEKICASTDPLGFLSSRGMTSRDTFSSLTFLTPHEGAKAEFAHSER